MLNMENAEEVMQILERFTRLKQKEIPKELDDYMHYVAKTGDTVFKWSSLKYLFREKLLNVIKNFHDTSPRVDDLPQYPNVDPFNYESMKSSLLERLELFNAAPFTVQRLCELLTEPRKQYSRIDKFMRALEKNILVSTIEPGRKRTESENGDSLDSVVNGDVSLDVNVDIDMENETIFNPETQSNATSSSTPSSQPSSNLTHKSDDDILPNPKKPKLDLDETNDAETAAATKSITNNKPDSAEPSAEKAIAEETTDIIDNKKNEERVAGEANASDEKPDAAAIKADSSKDNKASESEKMEEDTPIASTVENNNVDKIKAAEPEKKIDDKEETTITSTSAEVEVAEASPSSAPAPEATAAAPVVVEVVDSTEKTEKVDDEPEGKKKDCAEEVIEKQDTSKDIESKKVVKEKTDDEKTPKGNKKEIEEEKTETTITTTNSEKTNDKHESTPDETVAPCIEEKPKEVVKDKTNEVAVTPVAVVVEESKDEVETTKTKAAAVPEEPSKPLEAKPTEEVAATATAVAVVPVVPTEEVKETKIENATEPVKKVDAADQPPPVIESPKKESLETPAKILSTEPQEKETEKPAEVILPTAATPAESNDVAIPVVVDEPAVTADQPMDENPESIAEAEPVVPSIVVEAAANVEEVVMGDSVEMATDAIEPAKDEPAGMEVDDTSQEAMDQ